MTATTIWGRLKELAKPDPNIQRPTHGITRPVSEATTITLSRVPETYTPSPARVLEIDLTRHFTNFTNGVSEAVIKNPNPYRGIVATRVKNKMIRENVANYIELFQMGAREQAWSQLWSNFTKICYAVGVPVDTNADLRLAA